VNVINIVGQPELVHCALYLTRIDSYKEVAHTNNDIYETKVRYAFFNFFIRVDIQLQLYLQVDVLWRNIF